MKYVNYNLIDKQIAKFGDIFKLYHSTEYDKDGGQSIVTTSPENCFGFTGKACTYQMFKKCEAACVKPTDENCRKCLETQMNTIDACVGCPVMICYQLTTSCINKNICEGRFGMWNAMKMKIGNAIGTPKKAIKPQKVGPKKHT